jgi:arsenite methyltransferase
VKTQTLSSELCRLLADPETRQKLVPAADGSALRSPAGRSYPIVRGIPRLLPGHDEAQGQTQDCFAFKWAKTDTYDSPGSRKLAIEWLLQKYGFVSPEDWTAFFNSRKRILDIGCGGGFSASLWLDSPHWTGAAMYVGVDISTAADVALQRLGHLPNVQFVQGDALQLPFEDGLFDTVFSEGVLHHTPSTRAAIASGARVLASGGQFHFYVYKKKAPLREFADDYVRHELATLTNEGAWEAMRALTELGRALAAMRQTLVLPQDISVLGLQAGTFDLQRFFYNNVAKVFWNDELSFEENVHLNFDWYRPAYAHRQTPGEVSAWCEEANLDIRRMEVDDSGITVIAIKR